MLKNNRIARCVRRLSKLRTSSEISLVRRLSFVEGLVEQREFNLLKKINHQGCQCQADKNDCHEALIQAIHLSSALGLSSD